MPVVRRFATWLATSNATVCLEQNPAYGTARALIRNFSNGFTVAVRPILYTLASRHVPLQASLGERRKEVGYMRKGGLL